MRPRINPRAERTKLSVSWDEGVQLIMKKAKPPFQSVSSYTEGLAIESLIPLVDDEADIAYLHAVRDRLLAAS